MAARRLARGRSWSRLGLVVLLLGVVPVAAAQSLEDHGFDPRTAVLLSTVRRAREVPAVVAEHLPADLSFRRSMVLLPRQLPRPAPGDPPVEVRVHTVQPWVPERGFQSQGGAPPPPVEVRYQGRRYVVVGSPPPPCPPCRGRRDRRPLERPPELEVARSTPPPPVDVFILPAGPAPTWRVQVPVAYLACSNRCS